MVAVVSGSGLGLFGSSISTLGGGSGRGTDRVYVNAATGNLVVQSQDEMLRAVGLDIALVRTYNSQGLLDDDNGDNWRLGVQQRLYNLTGDVNTAGSTITKVFGDGREVIYRYDTGLSRYVSSDGDGAHDTLQNAAGEWTWTDGTGRNTETYDADGRLTHSRDADGNVVSYGYTDSLLTQITDASGQITYLDYDGGNLSQIRVVSDNVTQTLTRYSYDASNRLSAVRVDLSPQDNSILDGDVYVTSYTYDGASRRIESITQTDGSSISFTYELVNGQYRVRTYTDAMQRVTTLTYTSSGTTSQTVNANPGELSTTQTQTSTTTHELDDDIVVPGGPAWGTPQTSPIGETDLFPMDVQYDAAGNAFEIGEDIEGNLAVRRYDAVTEAWSAWESLSTAQISQRQWALDDAGNAVIVWADDANAINMRRYSVATGQWGPSEVLDASAGVKSLGTAVANNGHAAVTWVDLQAPAAMVAVSTPTGMLVQQITTGSAGSLEVSLDAAGNATAAWESFTDGVSARQFCAAAGTWDATQQLMPPAGPGTYLFVQALGRAANGDALLVLISASLDEETGAILMQTLNSSYSASSASWSTPVALSDQASEQAVKFDAQGNAALSTLTEGEPSSMSLTLYDAASRTWGSPATVELSAAQLAGMGQARMDVNGDSVCLAWTDFETGALYTFTVSNGGPGILTQQPSSGGFALPVGVSVAADGSVDLTWMQQEFVGEEEPPIITRVHRRFESGSAAYSVPEGATWQSLANALYGVNSEAAGAALQTALGNPTLSTGLQLVGLPSTLSVTTSTTVTVPAYYTVQEGDTWASITNSIYGVSDAAAIAALQQQLGNPSLTAGAQLTVPLTLSYESTSPQGATTTDITSDLGYVTTYVHDAEGRLTHVSTPTVNGARMVTAYGYDAAGNVTSVTEDPAGLNRVTTMTYDLSGNLLSRQDALGNTVTRTYDANNQLLSETVYVVRDPDGSGNGQPSEPLTTHYIYDAESHLRFTVTPEGRVTEHRYDAVGHRIATLEYKAGTYEGSPFGEADLVTWRGTQDLSEAERIDYAYDWRGHLETVSAYSSTTTTGEGAGAQSITRFVYDQRGQLLQKLDPRASGDPNPATPNVPYATTYTYDGLGRVLAASQWVSEGSVVTAFNDYDDASRTTTTMQANGLVTTSVYNTAGELISIANGVSGSIDAFGETRYAYDDLGRLRITTDPAGSRTFFFYDEAGRKTAEVDADGTLTEYIYDRASQLVKTVQYAALLDGSTLASLVEDEQPTSVDLATVRAAASGNAAEDRIVRHVYDSAGQKIYTIDAAGAVTGFVRDGAGRLIEEVQYANPVTIAREVDQVLAEDVTLQSSEDDRRTRYFYDDDGKLLGTLDSEGYLVEYEYDPGGYLLRQIAYALRTNAAYWAAGTLTDLRPEADDENQNTWQQDLRSYFFYDNQGRQVGILDAEGYLTQIVYDAAGRVLQRTRYDEPLPYGSSVTLGDLVDAVNDESRRDTAIYEYDGAGRVIRQTATRGTASAGSSVVTTFEYNTQGQLTSSTKAFGTNEARTTAARYDAMGRVTQELTAEGRALINGSMSQDEIEGIWSRYGVRHTYDLAGRRISSTQRPNDQQTNTTLYFYDAEHRLRFEVNALGEVKEHRYSSLNQLSETRVYTDRISTADLSGGAVTATLTSRVDAIAVAGTFAQTTFQYSLTGRLSRSATATSANAQQAVRTDFFYNAFGEERLRIQQIDEGENTRTLSRIQHYDRRGLLTSTSWESTAQLSDESRQYDAFGRLTHVTDARGNTSRVEYDRLGREVVTVDALGGRRATSYDAFSRILTMQDAALNLTSYSYDDAARTSTLTTPENISIVTTQNLHGQTVSVLANGNTTVYDYDANGHLRTVSDDLGTLESRTYDRAGRQVTQTDARGIVTSFAFDAANRVLTRTVDSATGGLGLVTTYVYDGQGRVHRIEEPGGRISETSYDRAGRVTQIAIDPDGLNLRSSYTYDRTSNRLTVTEGVGTASERTTQYVYDELGRRIEEIVDPIQLGGTLNLRTQFKYDRNGNLTRRIDARGNSTWYIHDAGNRLTHTIDSMGSVTRLEYDAENRVISTTLYAASVATAGFGDVVTSVSVGSNPNADRVSQSIYDRDGREKYSIDPAGAVTERTFDAAGNVIRTRAYSRTVAIGAYTTESAINAALVAAGNSLSTIHAEDQVRWTAFDERNRAVYSVDGAGAVVRMSYDAAGNVIAKVAYATLRSTAEATNLTSLDSWAGIAAVANHVDNRVSRYWYDGAGREVFELDGEGYLTETRYDDAVRRTSTILYRDRPTIAANATLEQVRTNSIVATFSATRDRISSSEQDVAGRVVRVFDAPTAGEASSYEEYGYDAVGNRVTTVDPRGVELAERDTAWAQARRVELGYAASASSLTAENRAALRMHYTTTRAFDAAGRETSVLDPQGGLTQKAYDAAGNLVRITDPRGSEGYQYYDAAGRVRYQVDPEGYVTELRYDAHGNVTDEFSYARPLTGTYNESTSLAAIEGQIETDTDRDRHIGKAYDQRGLVRVITHHNSPTTYTESFLYNAFGQKREYKDKNDAVFEYRYNARGDLTREILPPLDVVTAVIPNVVVQSLRLENVYEYTAFGERSLQREAAGTLQQRDTRYYYDNRGKEQRIELPPLVVFDPDTGSSTTQTPTTYKEYDSAGNLVLEVAPNGGRTVNYYDSRNLLIASVDADNVLREFQYDSVGNRIVERTYDTRFATDQSPDVRSPVENPTEYRELRHSYDANNRRTLTLTREEWMFSYQLLLQLGSGYYLAPVGTTASYDANGNLVKVEDGNGNPTYYFYDAKGNRTLQVDAKGYLIHWEYTAQGQVRRETKYAGQLTAQQLTQVESSTVATLLGWVPAGDDRITEYEYDQLGRTTVERKIGVAYASVDSSSGQLFEHMGDVVDRYEYDGNGNVAARILPGAHGRTDFTYDSLGRTTSQLDPEYQAFVGMGQALVTTRSQTSWQYDAHGNVVVQTQWAQNSGDNRELRYEYDTAGNVRRERDAAGSIVSYDYDVTGRVVCSTRQVVDVDGWNHTYRTYHDYDVLGREISHQDIEDQGTGTEVIRESQDTRYNAHGDIEAKGVNGQYQERYIYDHLGRLFWTNQENGTPRLHFYDGSGNAVLQLHAIDSDLTTVDDGAGVRAIRGAGDIHFISPEDVRMTVSLYDARNQLTDVFQPTMEFGDLLASTPVVVPQPGSVQGPPQENLNSLSNYRPPGLNYVNGRSYELTGPTREYIVNDADTWTGFGPWSNVNTPYYQIPVTSPPADWVPTAVPRVETSPEQLTTVSDTTSEDGLTRTVITRRTQVTTTTTITDQVAAGLLKVVVTRTETSERTTVFTRDHDGGYVEGEQGYEQTWTLDTDESTQTNVTENTKRQRMTHWREYYLTGAYVYGPSSELGSLTYTGGGHVTTEYRRDGDRETGVEEEIWVYVPDIPGFGDGPTTLYIDQQMTQFFGVGNGYKFVRLPRGSYEHDFRVYKGGVLIAEGEINGVNSPEYVTHQYAMPSFLSVKGLYPTNATATLTFLDNGQTVQSSQTRANDSGVELVFNEPSPGTFAAGRPYEYVVKAGNDVINVVRGTIGGAHNAQHRINTLEHVERRVAEELNRDEYYNNVDNPPPQAQLQNNYLTRLLQTITEGAVNEHVIRRQQAYNAFGEVVAEIDGRGYRTDLYYNDLGKVVRQEQPNTQIHYADGSSETARPTTHSYYDELGQLVGMQDANSDRLPQADKYYTTRALVNGRVAAEFDAYGNATRYFYDRLGDKRLDRNALGLETDYQYDRNGNLTLTHRYDELGALHSYDAYEYDEAGNRIAHTNARGFRERYLIDGLNRIVSHRSFENHETTYQYTWLADLAGIGGYEKVTTTEGVLGADTVVDREDYFGRIRYHRDMGGHEFSYLYNNAGWLQQQTGTTAIAGGREAQNITYEYFHNGYLKAISDSAISSYARFQYDLNGNRTIEAYSQVQINAGTPDQHPYQLAAVEYDELNRVKRVWEPGKFDIRYTYDAVGNRRSVESTYHDLLTNDTQQQNLYYAYDKMNRFTITMGARDLADADQDGNTREIVRGANGYEIEYDALGRRLNVWSGLGTQATREHYLYDPIDTVREAQTFNAYGVRTARAVRENDALGRLVDYREMDIGNQQTKHVHYEYNQDNLTVFEEDRTDAEYERTVYQYAGNGILVSTTGTSVYADGSVVPGSASVTLSYEYDKWDAYKESRVTIDATAENVRGWRDGTSTYSYDSNGHIEHLYDSQARRSIDYVNNFNGQVLKRYQIDHQPNGSDRPPEIRRFYYLNGRGIGDVGTDGVESRIDYAQSLAAQERDGRQVHPAIADRVIPVTSADFDQNYQPINPNYPGRTAQSHIVQAGETLESIARSVWGDASLWYLLADANGLSSNDQLVAGLRLTLPNVVTNIHNNSETFRPYDVALALGDTTPTLPDPPPPPRRARGGCGVLGMVLIAVVAIVVTVFTAGVAATAMGSAMGGIMSTGAAVLGGAGGFVGLGAAVVGGAVGAAASQGVAIAIGAQEEFNWKGVAFGGIGAGVTAGLGALAQGTGPLQQAIRTFADKNPYTFAAMNGASANALTQGIAVASGLQSSFNWRNVAISSVAAPVARSFGRATQSIARSTAQFGSTFAAGIGGSLVRRAFGSKEDSASIIADAFGSAFGNSLAYGAQSEPDLGVSSDQWAEVQREVDRDVRASLALSGAAIGAEAQMMFDPAVSSAANLAAPKAELAAAAGSDPLLEYAKATIGDAWNDTVRAASYSGVDRQFAAAFNGLYEQPQTVSVASGVSGIVPFAQARDLPNTVSVKEGMPTRGNYQIVANLPVVDGEVAGVPTYYSAYNTHTKNIDYVIGQTDLGAFLKSTAAYESMTYLRPYERESLATLNSMAAGDVSGALGHFGRSYVEAGQDPSWLLQMGMSLGGAVLARGPRLSPYGTTIDDEIAGIRRIGEMNSSADARVFQARIGLKQHIIGGDVGGLIANLDVSTGGRPSGFWSGNLGAATSRANAANVALLETTPGGRIVNNWPYLNKKWTWANNGEQFWSGLSSKYARGATDDVLVWQAPNKAYDATGNLTWKGGDVWQKYEHPILKQLQSVGTVRNISYEMVEPSINNSWLRWH